MSYYKDGKKYTYIDIDDEDYDFEFAEKVLERKKDGLFHIGQDYDEKPAPTYYCKKCGGREFNVGAVSHWTGIRCVKCGWEVCIHEG